MNERRNQRPKAAVSSTTIIGLLLAILLFVGLFLFLNPGQPGTYTSYKGPILPLTSLSGAENLTVERNVTLDFASCAPKWSAWDQQYLDVVDSYILTNPTDEAVTVELAWGFEGQFVDNVQEFPAITVDGRAVESMLYPAADPEQLIYDSGTWQKYFRVLEENDFLAEAMSPTPQWDTAVKVYRFYDMAYEGDLPYLPDLDISYRYGESTILYVIGDSYIESYDKEHKEYHLTCGADGEVVLLVIGDDLVDMTAGGGVNHTVGVYQGKRVDGLTYQSEIYETTFMEWLREYVQDYQYVSEETGTAVEYLTAQMCFDGVMRQIVGTEYQQPGEGARSMDNLLYSVVSGIRMMYRVFPVEIPAGGSVTVTGRYQHPCSQNNPNLLQGCDLATTLGSNLNFVSQTAALANLQQICWQQEEQNFGFDPEQGILTAELDLAVERYYLGMLPLETE